MRKQQYVLVIALATVALLALAACGGKPAEEQPTAAPAATQQRTAPAQPEATSTPTTSAPGPTATSAKPSPTPRAPTATPEPTKMPATDTPEPVDEEISVSALTEGLAGLNSYRIAMLMTYEGKDENGEPSSGSWETIQEITRDPAAQRTIISTKGSQEASFGYIEMVLVGGVSYMISESDEGEHSCVSFTSDDNEPMDETLFTPDSLGGFGGAKYRGTEVVNGVRCRRYEWSESAASIFGFGQSQGQAWLAVDGGYVVKYTAEASGGGALLGTDLAEGRLIIEYNLTDVDSGLVIEVPGDCEVAASDIPVMPDAQDRASFGTMVTYSSPSPFDDVVAFYKDGMTESGWQQDGEGMQFEGTAILNYTKDGRTAQVMISFDEDSKLTSVVVTTSEE